MHHNYRTRMLDAAMATIDDYGPGMLQWRHAPIH